MNSLTDRYLVSSDPLRTERRVELAVVVLSVLLALQLLWGAYSVFFPAVPDPILPTPASLQVGSVIEPVRVTPEQRTQVQLRPVFWASRQPLQVSAEELEQLAAAEAQKEKKPGQISGVKLSGVFGSGDSAGIIVLADGKKSRLLVGEELKGWTLDSVTPVEAVFSSGGEQASLQLKRGEPVAIAQGKPVAEQGGGGKKPESVMRAPKESESLGLGGGARVRKKTTKKQ